MGPRRSRTAPDHSKQWSSSRAQNKQRQLRARCCLLDALERRPFRAASISPPRGRAAQAERQNKGMEVSEEGGSGPKLGFPIAGWPRVALDRMSCLQHERRAISSYHDNPAEAAAAWHKASGFASKFWPMQGIAERQAHVKAIRPGSSRRVNISTQVSAQNEE